MTKFFLAGITIGAIVLFEFPAFAAGFTVEPLQDGGKFIGCLAQNTASGIGFLAVGDKVAMFANSPELGIAKGDKIDGSYSIDGGEKTAFSAAADAANTASIDVENTTEAVTAITTGKTLSVTANGKDAEFNLTGAEGAFTDLIACMTQHNAM